MVVKDSLSLFLSLSLACSHLIVVKEHMLSLSCLPTSDSGEGAAFLSLACPPLIVVKEQMLSLSRLPTSDSGEGAAFVSLLLAHL